MVDESRACRSPIYHVNPICSAQIVKIVEGWSIENQLAMIARLAIYVSPGFATYENHSQRIGWFKATVPFRIFWFTRTGMSRTISPVHSRATWTVRVEAGLRHALSGTFKRPSTAPPIPSPLMGVQTG